MGRFGQEQVPEESVLGQIWVLWITSNSGKPGLKWTKARTMGAKSVRWGGIGYVWCSGFSWVMEDLIEVPRELRWDSSNSTMNAGWCSCLHWTVANVHWCVTSMRSKLGPNGSEMRSQRGPDFGLFLGPVWGKSRIHGNYDVFVHTSHESLVWFSLNVVFVQWEQKIGLGRSGAKWVQAGVPEGPWVWALFGSLWANLIFSSIYVNLSCYS